MLGPLPWNWLAQALLRTETDYCEIEQAWFTRHTASHCWVVRLLIILVGWLRWQPFPWASCFFSMHS
jgi:hypothetical protein